MYFWVNKFEVGVNDSIFSGNEQQKVYMRGDKGEKFSHSLCRYIYIYCRYLSKDSGHSRMPCAISGTGMLLTKPYLGYLGPY